MYPVPRVIISSRLALLCGVLTICNCFPDVWPTENEGYYTIVAPRTIRSYSTYNVSISLSECNHCSFNISISFFTSENERREIFETVEIEPETTKLVKMQMPRLYYGFGNLTVHGYGGIDALHVNQISIEECHYSVYIQTDKAKYKPGELMQFRVICIDRLTRPVIEDENIAVLIYDGELNLVKEFSNVKLVQGVFKGDLQLSEYPVLGEWKIEVKSFCLTMKKSFHVARYVLPNFSVDIITKKNIALDDGQIVMLIKARYTYDEPIQGNLTISLSTIYDRVSASYTSLWRIWNTHYPKSRRVVKETLINGEATVILDFKTDLNISSSSSEYHSIILYKFGLEARVQDALTGKYSQTTTEIAVYNHPYKIQIETEKFFDSKEPVNITVSVTDLQRNAIRDTKNPVTVTIEGTFETEYNTSFLKKITVYLNENGVGVVSLNLTNETFLQYSVKAEYLGWTSQTENIEKIGDYPFNLDILTERPEVGKELLIQLRSIDPIGYFSYEIISRGDIIQSERISVSGNETTYLLRIKPTYSMVPKIALFVHRTKNETFDARLREIYIKQAFQNSIKIDTDKEVQPGASVSINVTTDEGSYVGLMAVDQRLLLQNTKDKDDLTEDNVFTKLRDYDSLNRNNVPWPGFEAGLFTYFNAIYISGLGPRIVVERPEKPEEFDKPVVKLPRIRKLFSESWMFEDFERTPAEGLKLQRTVPDTITSWAITGFSLNRNTGLSLTKNATTLKVFQKFFVSMNLPSLIKEGEIIEIPVYVFNYMREDLRANVTIDSSNGELELLDNLNSKPRAQPNKTISKSIPAQGRAKLVFLVRPLKPGRYNVTVTAISPKASDAVNKMLTVSPDGVPYSISKTYLVHFLQESEQEDEISVDIPENTVQGSESVQLSVVGDIFGPLMESLKRLVKVPYGNGEVNIRYFVSNLLVLKYLKILNHSNPSIESKAKLHLELGYQTQMTFKRLDGSFSFFNRTVGRTGDLWLTAYVMWGLQQAKHFISVDRQVIDRGLAYLKSKQRENGGFSSGGCVEDDVSLTAFTLLSILVEEKNEQQYKEVITKGLLYLYGILDNLKQSTPTVISIYAFVLGKHEKSGELLAKLTSSASVTSKEIIWTKPDNLQSILETTAASFMSLVEFQKKPVHNLLPMVRALISTGQGEKTPVHMIALEAMIKFVRDMDFGRKDLNLLFYDNQKVSGEIHVDSKNARVLQTIELAETSRKVRVRTKGKGFAIVNVKYRYNLLPQNQSSNHQTNITIKESTDPVLALEACVAVRSPGNQINLTAMEVNLQSGYTFDENTFKEVQTINEQVKSIQINGDEGSVLLYIENIDKNGICIQLKALKTYNVFNAKSASIVVYDFRKEDERSVSFLGNA